MTHELTTLELPTVKSDIEFLQSYLGSDLYAKIDKLFKIASMPKEVLAVYRKTAELMAELIPEADQLYEMMLPKILQQPRQKWVDTLPFILGCKHPPLTPAISSLAWLFTRTAPISLGLFSLLER